MSRAHPPGIYADIPSDTYHADQLTEQPALSQSLLKILLNQSPEHARDRHPRLTTYPEYEWAQTDAMKVGAVAHSMLLGAGDRYKVFVASDFTTKNGEPAKTLGCAEAQEAIAAWRATGGLDINEKTMRNATAITDKMMAAILADYPMWSNGRSEVTLLFPYRLNNGAEIQCKARLDRLVERCVCVDSAEPHIHAFDPKFSRRNATAAYIDKTAELDGWFMQEAMYVIGLEKLQLALEVGPYDPILFTFIVGELTPPYATQFVTLADDWRADGRADIDRGANIWGECLRTGVWPSRPRHHVALRPTWAMDNKLEALMDSLEEES